VLAEAHLAHVPRAVRRVNVLRQPFPRLFERLFPQQEPRARHLGTRVVGKGRSGFDCFGQGQDELKSAWIERRKGSYRSSRV
jgi:hypothetical protein